MIVTDLVFYTTLICWGLAWVFISSIKAKIGNLVYPIMIVFGFFVFSIRTIKTDSSITVEKAIDLFSSIHLREVCFAVAVIVVVVGGHLIMRKFLN